MIASRTALLLAVHLFFSPATSQKLFSLDYKYSRTKYNESKRNRGYQNSFSYQFLAGVAKEVKDGLRLGIKAGFTIDKIFSHLSGRNIQNFSRNNVLAYAGVNIQKRLLADPKQTVALWISTELAAEPFISRKSVFVEYYPVDSFPQNTMVNYNGVYTDKRTRFSCTPMLKAEVKITQKIGLFAQGGYAIELGKSNLVHRYFTNIFTLTNYPDFLPPAERIKENYLFAGGGINYSL